MKNLSKIISILLFIVLSVNIQAENIDECQSDLYFANGIMMKYSEKDAEKKWRLTAKKLFALNPDAYAKIENVKMAYNVSQGFLDDLLESFEQAISNEWGWKDFSVYFTNYLKIHGIQELDYQHNIDLVQHINAYKNSIKLGHSVIVIAHSQGNYFTNEAYEYLDTWMQPYFHMMGVATPANHVAGYEIDDSTAPYLKFHNDMIKSVAGGLPTNRDNANTEHNSDFSVEAHDFYTSYLTDPNTRQDIHDFIVNQIDVHSNTSTQWETDEEFNLNTCNYKVTVQHRHDPSIEMAEKVYPLNASKKLYQAKNKQGVYEWVKASCGGKNIIDLQDNNSSECWMIDNVEEEKIEEVRRLFGKYYGYAYMEVLGGQNLFGLHAYISKPISTSINQDIHKSIYSDTIDLATTSVMYKSLKKEVENLFLNDVEKLKEDYAVDYYYDSISSSCGYFNGYYCTEEIQIIIDVYKK